MTIRNAKVKLNGIDIQVNTMGVKPLNVTVVDELRPWLSREKIAATRNDDDSLGFDVVTLSGKRIRVKYGTAEQLPVPINNADALDSLYSKYIHTVYELSGEGMPKSDAFTFYNLYRSTQERWAQLASIRTKLAEPDIPATSRSVLIAQYNALNFTDLTMALWLYGNSYTVMFAEGQSCNFIDWVIGNYTDFNFTLLTRTPIS